MPQLSLYLDSDMHQKLEARALLSKTSVSKFVTTILKTHFSKGWPEGFQNVYGSISDESFAKQEVPDWSLDIPRESL